MNYRQSRDSKTGTYTSTKTKFIRFYKRTLIISVLVFVTCGAVSVNNTVRRFIDNNITLQNRLIELERENALIVDNMEAEIRHTQISEALWWSDSADATIKNMLAGNNDGAFEQMGLQAKRLESFKAINN